MTIIEIAHRTARRIAPTLTVRELTARISYAERLMARWPIESNQHTVASAAYDEYKAEIDRRHAALVS